MVAALVWVFLPPVPLLPPETGFSGVVTARDGSLLHLSLAPDGRYRLRADLDQISPHLIAAVLRMEDQHFYRHHGVNPGSLARAALAAATGRKGGGGSTITMQLAKLRFRLDTRSLAGECAQIARAIQLERHYSKRQILEAYLTLAPCGGNVEGAEAAALIWCGKPARDLTAREAAALAVLPQSPARRTPRAGSANPALTSAQHRLWKRLGAGRPNPAFVARDTAAPLLLACAQALRLEASAEPPPPPEVAEVEFCAVSGSLPSPHCPHRKRGWFAPGLSPISPCAVHREVLTDNATGLRVLAGDGTRDLRREVFEFWPADLLALFRDAGLPRREPPPLEPGARALAAALANEAPEITSPREALVYTLRPGDEQRNRIALEARAAPGARKLFWFADGALIGSAEPGSPLFWRPAPGARLVHVCDDQGRSSSCRIRVEQAD